MDEDRIRILDENAGGEQPPLDSQSSAILQALSDRDPALASLYMEGRRLVSATGGPANVFLLAHVGRELSRAVLPVDLPLEPGRSTEHSADRHRDRIASFLGLPRENPTVGSWFRLHGEFQRAAHYREQAPSFNHIQNCFQQLDDLLFGLLAPYFDTHEELQALIDEAHPTERHVTSLERLLVRPQQRRHFFSHLRNPEWLEPLLARGHFSSPPEVHGEDETWRHREWPQGRFLVNLAGESPREVAAVILSLPDSLQNPIVWLTVLEASEAMPVRDASDLVPRICRALGGTFSGYFAFRAATLAHRLAKAGLASSFDLAYRLLSLQPEEAGSDSGTADWPLMRLREHEGREFFVETMPALVKIDRLRATRLQVGLLARVAPHDEGSQHWCENLDAWPSEHRLASYLAVSLAKAAVGDVPEPVDFLRV